MYEKINMIIIMYWNAYQTKLHIELEYVSLCYDKLQLIQFDIFTGYLY